MRVIYPLFVTVVIIFGLYVVKLNFSSLFDDLDWMKIDRIRFYGLKSVQAKDLTKRISLNENSSLIFISKRKIKEQIEKDKRLKVEKILIKLPDTLEIYILEDMGDFLYRKGKDIYSINYKGDILSSNESIYYYNLPVLSLENSQWDQKASKEKEKTNLNDRKLNDTKGALKDTAHDVIQNTVTTFNEIPNAEKDFKDLISEIKINGKTTFYLRNGIKVITSSPLTLAVVRKARYSTLYALSLEKKVDTIDTRQPLVKYRFR